MLGVVNTHYYYRPPILDGAAFSAFAADVKKLFAATPADIILRSDIGTQKPEATAKRVAFNGDASHGNHYEPFILEQTYTRKTPDRARDGVFFDFTKTHGKPYDLIVVAVLYAFIHHFPACKFTSDSTMDELRPGFDLFVQAVQPQGDIELLYLRPQNDKAVIK